MTIVVAIDRSPARNRLLEEAAALGSAFREEVHVVHVLTQSEFLDLESTAVEESGRPVDMDEVRRVAERVANEAIEDIEGPFTPVGLVGDVPDQIVRYAEDNNARYLVVGGRQRSPTGKAIFGSITQSVLLNAGLPVVTVIDRKEG